jgi:zinc protease
MDGFPRTAAHRWTLPNGLTLLVQEDHSAPVASVQAWCETGSITEGAHLGAGLSHLLEHLLFKGTPTRPANAIACGVQDAGGYINAYTSFDRTVYWIDIPAAGVGTAIDLLADAMLNSELPPEEYAKEQEVIRREFAMGHDDPDRTSSQMLFANAFHVHPYRHPVIGHLDLFNALSRDEVMEYYQERYVPNNLFFVVVGAVDAHAVRSQIERLFEPHPRRLLPPVFIPAEPPQLGRREEHEAFPTELTRLDLAWHIPEVTHPDVPALDLLSLILGSGRSSRFYRTLRDGAGLVHSIGAWCYTPGQPGLFGIDAVLDPTRRDAATQAILQAIEQARQDGFTDAELRKAQKRTLAGQLHGLTTMRGIASDLGSNWMLTRNLDFTRDYLAAVERVTRDDLQRVVRTYFDERNLTLVSLNPVESPQRIFIEKRTPPAAAPIQKFELSNGLRLLVREDPRLPLVSAVACFKAGLLAETPADNGITRLFARTLLKGTATRSAETIAESIEAIGGGIGAEAGNNSFHVGLHLLQPDLEFGLELLADVLRHPVFPEAAVAREQTAQLAAIQAEDEEMTSLARNLVRQTLFDGHPYGMRANGSKASVAALTREALLAFHARHTVGRNGVLAIFGNVKAETVRAWAEATLGALPAGAPALETPPLPPPLVGTHEVSGFLPKEQAVLMVGYRGADVRSADRLALELIDEACSDLGSRFFVRIREKLGLAYFVGTSFVPGLVPGPFVFYLGTDPGQVEAVKAELLDEIQQLARHGLTAEELARAKQKRLGQEAIRNQSADALAHASALDELYGLGFDAMQRLPAEIEAITLDQIRDVAARTFDGQPSVQATVLAEEID